MSIIVCVALGITLSGFLHAVDNVYPSRFEALARTFQFAEAEPNSPRATGMQSLSDSDIAALRAQLDPALIAQVVPMVQEIALFDNRGKIYRGGLIGSTPHYLEYKNSQLIAGRMFSDEEYNNGARVVLITSLLVDDLFNGDQSAAMGSALLIGRVSFRIVGIFGADATGQTNTSAVVPLDAARDDLYGGPHAVTQIGFITTHASLISQATAQVVQILSNQHTPKKGYLEGDFVGSVYQAPGLAIGADLLRTIFYLLLSLAFIALVFGTVQLSLMLSKIVAEHARTLELFLAMQVKRGAIFRQVLAESTVVAAVSGLLGVILGLGLLEWAQRALPTLAPQYGVPQISVAAIAGAFSLSVLAGVIAGVLPARRAAHTQLQRLTVSYGCCPAIGALHRETRHGSFLARANHSVAAPVVTLGGPTRQLELSGGQKVRAS
jgi:putative ABC transport system permease protein